MCDVVFKIYQGVLYLQNVVRFPGTQINKIPTDFYGTNKCLTILRAYFLYQVLQISYTKIY